MGDYEFPSRVTLFEDGIYRWSYDMDMKHNLFMLKKILKVICAIFIIPLVVSLVSYIHRYFEIRGIPNAEMRARVLAHEMGNIFNSFFGICLLLFIGMIVLTLIVYLIAAQVMHWNYHLRFAMDEEIAALIHSEKASNMMHASAMISGAVGAASGHPGKGLSQMLAINAGIASAVTAFRDVAGVKPHPKEDVIDLRLKGFGYNQIYVPPEDFEFVKDFILAHCSRKK